METSNSIELLEDSLAIFHKLGVLDFSSQVAVYSEYYAQAISEGRNGAAEKLKKTLETISINGIDFMGLEKSLISLKQIKENLEVQYFSVKIDAEEDFVHKFVVNRAEKAEVKSKPIRWLIVLIATLSTFIFSLVLLAFRERNR